IAFRREGIGHSRQINDLPDIGISFPSRPEEIKLAIVLKRRSIDGPFVAWQCKLTFVGPGISERVTIIFEHPHSVVLVVTIIGSVVDVPLSSEKMDLRRPDLL